MVMEARMRRCETSLSTRPRPRLLPALDANAGRRGADVCRSVACRVQELIDMRTLLISDAELASAQAKLAEYKKLGSLPPGTTEAEMWEANPDPDPDPSPKPNPK